MEVKLGKYKHFKGGMYEVLDVANHSETLEKMVVYKHLDGEKKEEMWVRPLEMFVDYKVFEDGTEVKRFEFVE